jgi:hypothetical protein
MSRTSGRPLGALVGCGARLAKKTAPGRATQSRVNENLLTLAVVGMGVALTIGLFWSAP